MRFEAPADFLDILTGVEGRDAEIAFTCGAKARAGGDNDLGFLEHFIKHLPRAHPFGAANPNVWGIDAAKDLKSERKAGLAEKLGISHVVMDECGNLFFTLFGKDRRRSFLDGVGCSVELGGMATGPELVNRHRSAILGATGN